MPTCHGKVRSGVGIRPLGHVGCLGPLDSFVHRRMTSVRGWCGSTKINEDKRSIRVWCGKNVAGFDVAVDERVPIQWKMSPRQQWWSMECRQRATEDHNQIINVALRE